MSCNFDCVMETSWGDLASQIIMSAPSIPRNIVERALRDAAIEFAASSHLVRFNATVDLQEGVGDYPICPPDGYIIRAVSDVCSAQGTLRPGKMDSCGNVACGHYAVQNYRTIIINAPSCDQLGGLSFVATVQPSQHSCYAPSILVDRYSEALVEGALSRLYVIPNTTWFDTLAGGIMLRRFNARINDAKNAVGGGSESIKYFKTPRFL